MSAPFELSFALLWAVVLAEALVLAGTLSEVIRIMEHRSDIQHTEFAVVHQLQKGTPAPLFAANALGGGETVRTADLKGRSTIILFISPRESTSPAYEKLAASTHALWHRSQGQLYVICSGAEQPCRKLIRDYSVEGVGCGRIPLILDENQLIANSFSISSTPMAIMLDEEAKISRYGEPILGGEVQWA
jgi:peroxiredoxin